MYNLFQILGIISTNCIIFVTFLMFKNYYMRPNLTYQENTIFSDTFMCQSFPDSYYCEGYHTLLEKVVEV